MRRIIIVALALLSVSAGTANAATPRLFTVAEQAGGKQVANPSQFTAIIGYPNQCVAGINCWTYTKGTRSPVSTYPESWYLHVGGVRVTDSVYHLFVMDPRSTGWRQHVASVCGQSCFLDAMGSSALTRDNPVVPWSASRWLNATAGIARAVVAAGKRAMPNSAGPNAQVLVDAAGRASTESFTPATAQTLLAMGRIWVSERGDCLAKYAAFLQYSQRHDHFSCYAIGALPWDASWLPSN